MIILETERLILREITPDDAEFVLDLLNQPSFIKYIGDRGVRKIEQARDFIESRYIKSYIDHGYGLYAVELKADNTPIGMCGFVRRDSLPGPDIGFRVPPAIRTQRLRLRIRGGDDGLRQECSRLQTSPGDHVAGQRPIRPPTRKDRAAIRPPDQLPPDNEVLKLFVYR